MMTRLEQELYEVSLHCIPRIAESLERIAKSLEVFRGNTSDQPKPREDNDV